MSAVDLTNFAEASRSLFLLDEAEQTLLEAADAQVSWYGNPHLELAELYLREARFTEALGALRRVPPYRAQRPPHARDAVTSAPPRRTTVCAPRASTRRKTSCSWKAPSALRKHGPHH